MALNLMWLPIKQANRVYRFLGTVLILGFEHRLTQNISLCAIVKWSLMYYQILLQHIRCIIDTTSKLHLMRGCGMLKTSSKSQLPTQTF